MFSKENLIKNSHTLKHNGSQKLQPKLDTITQSVLCSKQVSAVADEHARRAASRQTCCKQRWTLSVINLRPNSVDNAYDDRRFRVMRVICRKLPILTYPTCTWRLH